MYIVPKSCPRQPSDAILSDFRKRLSGPVNSHDSRGSSDSGAIVRQTVKAWQKGHCRGTSPATER